MISAEELSVLRPVLSRWSGKDLAVRLSTNSLSRSARSARYMLLRPALYKNQTPQLAVLIGMLLASGKIDEDQSGALCLANYVLTGGQLYPWKRAEAGPANELMSRLLDASASLLDQGTWQLLERLFPTTRPPHYTVQATT
jgi:hypothetical protein